MATNGTFSYLATAKTILTSHAVLIVLAKDAAYSSYLAITLGLAMEVSVPTTLCKCLYILHKLVP